MSFFREILGETKPLEYTEHEQGPVLFTVAWSSVFLFVFLSDRDKVASSTEALIAKSAKNMRIFETFVDIVKFQALMNKQWKAIPMQKQATYGLSRSPIRAHFQNVPKGPVFLLSSNEGQRDLR